jgi:hypothetical protein
MGSALAMQREIARKNKLTISQKEVLYGAPVLYAFKGIRHQAITTSYSKHGIDASVLDFRRSLWSNGELLRDGKVFTYALVADQRLSTKCKLSVADRNSLKLALQWKPLQQYLKRLHRNGYSAYTPERLGDLTGRALYNKEIQTYVNRFVYKKHSFLESYGKPADEIKSDLISWGLYALLKAYPKWENAGHMLAIAKTAIHNRGINIIAVK